METPPIKLAGLCKAMWRAYDITKHSRVFPAKSLEDKLGVCLGLLRLVTSKKLPKLSQITEKLNSYPRLRRVIIFAPTPVDTVMYVYLLPLRLLIVELVNKISRNEANRPSEEAFRSQQTKKKKDLDTLFGRKPPPFSY